MSAEQRLWEVDCLTFVRVVATVWWRKEEKAEGFFGFLLTETSPQQVPVGRCWKDVRLRCQLNKGFGRYLLDLSEGGSHFLVEKGGEGGGIFVGMF